MSPVAIAKLALALAGIVVFLVGIRIGMPMIRWTGIGLVVVAWLLRFAERKPARSRNSPGAGPDNDPPEDP